MASPLRAFSHHSFIIYLVLSVPNRRWSEILFCLFLCFPCIIWCNAHVSSTRHWIYEAQWKRLEMSSAKTLCNISLQDLLMLSSKYFSVPVRSLHHQRAGVSTNVSLCFSSISSTIFQLVSLPFILSSPIHSPLQFPKYRSDGSLSCLKLFKSSQLTCKIKSFA